MAAVEARKKFTIHASTNSRLQSFSVDVATGSWVGWWVETGLFPGAGT
ncbi:hypothetical protein [Occultella glacieicola]|nr:hypothetical protein [Occultella glacieicola]